MTQAENTFTLEPSSQCDILLVVALSTDWDNVWHGEQ